MVWPTPTKFRRAPYFNKLEGQKSMDTRTETAMGQDTRDITKAGRETTERLTEAARDAGNRISAKWQQARESVQERTRAGAEATDRTVREHPYASIGVAFCAGLLLGVLLVRR
jgi:ElaB/YqjD/DUF883 family membrane-anchored ribosome-binding protein